MKAAEIRKINGSIQSKALQTKSRSAQEGYLASITCTMLCEIAAQLAEANEHLAKIANPPMVIETPPS